MKNKAEVIKEAWIAEIGEEKYNDFSSYINENGWLKKGHVFIQSVNELDWSEGGLRPRSLRDFEHNNGWYRIDEVGLPKEEGYYDLIDCGQHCGYIYFYKGEFRQDGNIYSPTHWRHHNEDKPIY